MPGGTGAELRLEAWAGRSLLLLHAAVAVVSAEAEDRDATVRTGFLVLADETLILASVVDVSPRTADPFFGDVILTGLIVGSSAEVASFPLLL